ncbi:hypothetical protein [Gordonia sp. OPL2]|uniref:hypothetical protein n=1 Tax=Gordonia sp. OPL2 TaxID=2486274 RepID=UPI001655FEDF|nr:hypothetical protein [Gordonia sp. OPL2]ROZ88984.1 hypothetical protein EEB19_19940 [Gordonia sp. OPL2]
MPETPTTVVNIRFEGVDGLRESVTEALVGTWGQGLADGYELACTVIEELVKLGPDTKLADALAGLRLAQEQQIQNAAAFVPTSRRGGE